MRRHLRRTSVRVVLVAVSALGAVLWTVDAVWSMQESKEVARMSNHMKTVCVGRFLIDVPASAQVSISSAAVDGFDIVNYGAETAEQFAARLARREQEINAGQNPAGGKNMASVRAIDRDGVAGKVFVFGLSSTHGYHGPEKVVYSGAAVQGYAHVGGISLGLSASDYPPEQADRLARLIEQLQPLAPGAMPTQPGFCLDGAFLRDPLTAAQHERIVMLGGIPGHADLGFVLSTMAGTVPDGDGLLARHAANSGAGLGLMNVLVSTLLSGPRSIAGLDGEELAFKVRETNFSTGYAFQWEAEGVEDDVLRPFVSLELQTGTNPEAGGPPVQSSVSEASLGDLWHHMSASLRVRPVDQPVDTDAGIALELALGTLAWAGETCQQSGWWECSGRDPGVGVFGGARQFMRAGQRLPQALLLPRATVWQKVRGVQPTVEAATPTGWRLADRRSQRRIEAAPAPA